MCIRDSFKDVQLMTRKKLSEMVPKTTKVSLHEALEGIVGGHIQSMKASVGPGVSIEPSVGVPGFTFFDCVLSVGGERREFEVKALCVSNVLTNTTTLVMFKDVTHLRAAAQARESAMIKTRMLASLSHEIRTPTNAGILLLQAAMGDQQVSNDVREAFIEPTLCSLQYLNYFINDFVDFTQINFGNIELHVSKFNLRRRLANLIRIVEVQARTRGLTIFFDYDARVPVHVTNDDNRVAQIVMNFLTNALKFTLQGEVRLSVTPVDEAASFLRLSVSDTGIGMNSDCANSLCELLSADAPFHISESLETRGIGFGLNMTRRLAHLIGAQNLGFKTELGKGTTFWIDLPIAIVKLESGDFIDELSYLEEKDAATGGRPSIQTLRHLTVIGFGSNRLQMPFDIEVEIPMYSALICLLYTSPSPRDRQKSRMPSSA
eukprot:TRINITY_DN19929_c0_g1_i1.p1 TRINITY_DN19929_c0_g1~~TRINITY_DN19929_c0_g1_i1.p1  ORF type:complete len:433 (+),score=85.82 TRINITY_DN19929_c0_g1_i1:64-1362(+)